MAVNPERSVLAGIDESFNNSQNYAAAEAIVRQFVIDWDKIPGATVQVIATVQADLPGASNVTLRCRRNTSSLLTLGSTILASSVEVPPGIREVTLDSGSFAKPAGRDALQFTQQGGQVGLAATLRTISVGIVLETNGVVWFAANPPDLINVNTGNEVFMREIRVNWDKFPAGNVEVTWAGNAFNTNFGPATIRVRQGGTYHGVDGTIVASGVVPINNNAFFSFSGTFARPSGVSSLKTTAQEPNGGSHQYQQASLLIVPV